MQLDRPCVQHVRMTRKSLYMHSSFSKYQKHGPKLLDSLYYNECLHVFCVHSGMLTLSYIPATPAASQHNVVLSLNLLLIMNCQAMHVHRAVRRRNARCKWTIHVGVEC